MFDDLFDDLLFDAPIFDDDTVSLEAPQITGGYYQSRRRRNKQIITQDYFMDDLMVYLAIKSLRKRN